MKVFTLCVSMLLWGIHLSAQHWDISLNPLRFIKAEVTAEKGINPHLSFVAGLAFGRGDSVPYPEAVSDSLITDFFQSGRVGTFLTSAYTDELDAYLGMRYYFIPKRGNDGVFAGASLMYRTTTHIKKQPYVEKPDDQLWFRVPVGYKWAFNSRFVLETGVVVLMGSDNDSSLGGLNALETRFHLLGKVGYRFTKNSK